MEHTGNQSTLQSHVADDGINLFITADEIGIDQLDLFDVAAILSKFPREATVFALSRLAHIVHHSGEATKGIQEEICREFLPSPYRERALSLLEEENRVLVTYEGLVRLCYLSQLYSPARPSVSALPDEARTLLLFLIPSIHKAVFEPADLRLEAGLAELENIKQTRLFTFLAVNSVGLSFPAQEYLFHASVGALATEFISQGLTGGPLKELNRADAVLFQTYGTSLTELHASLLKLTMRWMHVPTEPGEIPSN